MLGCWAIALPSTEQIGKVFDSSMFSMNFLLLFVVLQCYSIAVLTCQTFHFIGFLKC